MACDSAGARQVTFELQQHPFICGLAQLNRADVAAACLQLSAAHSAELDAFQRIPAGDEQLQRFAQLVLNAAPQAVFPPSVLNSWLKSGQHLPDWARLRAIAEALDASTGAEGLLFPHDPGTHRLVPGEVIQRGSPPYDRLWSGTQRLSTRPQSLGASRWYRRVAGGRIQVPSGPQRLRSLVVVPAGADFVLHQSRFSVFDPDAHLRIAFGLPNHDLDAALTFDTHTDDDGTWFENVRPRDMADQRRRLRQLVDSAKVLPTVGGRMPDVLVLPELCTTPDLAAETLDASQPIPLVLAGSHHHDQRNSAPFRLGRSLRGLHHKRNRFEHRSFGHERIIVETGLHLVRSGGWLVCPLICKDLLDLNTLQLLGAVGCNLVLVAALSDRTDPFESSAELIGTHLQGITAIANAALQPDAAVPALLGLPLREHGLRLNTPPDHRRDGLWIVDVGLDYSVPEWSFEPLV